MTKLKIEYLPIDALKPYEKNARKHTDADVQNIVASINEFGFDDPIGIWGEENLIVEGHGRLLAAKKLGMETVPCIRLDHLTDEQRRAYALAHNKTAEMSEWDSVILPEALSEILNIDMEQFGFDITNDDVFTPADERKGNMAEKYLVPPFSVIYGNKPDWLARKRAWIDFGIRSEVGRGGNLLSIHGAILRQTSYQPGGGTKQSVQEQQQIKRVSKSKAYADGLIDKREKIRKGTYRGDTI